MLRLIAHLVVQDKKHLIALAIFLMILLSVSCGGEDLELESNVSVQLGSEVDSCFLIVVDSIGVELGDSNLVFGAVGEVDTGPDGDIYVLDWIRCTVFRFSSEGDFIQRIGRRGSGPGEMLQGYFFAVMDDGSVSLNDAELGWMRFDSTGDCTISASILSSRPMWFTAMDSVNILGMLNELSRGDNCLTTEKRICSWNADRPDSVITEYISKQYSIEFGSDYQLNMSDLVEIDCFPILFCSGDGFVCIAPEPRADPMLLFFNEDGSALDTLMLPYPEVVRTDEELLEQKQFVEEFFYVRTQHSLQVDWEPFPNKPMITNLGVDRLNRIWVQRGFEDYPTFDLYNVSGEHLKTVALHGREDTDHWKFHISRNGILAVPEDPENYYSVYILELQE